MVGFTPFIIIKSPNKDKKYANNSIFIIFKIGFYLINIKFEYGSINMSTTYTKIKCKPLNDRNKRFLLGKQGKVELLAIGLNPSKANEEKLDPTSRNIEKIANNNGCDGWWLINLYPKRTSKPINLPKTPDSNLTHQNLIFIKNLLKDPKFKIIKILCCWGNHIDDHLYLKLQAVKILDSIKEYNLSLYCIGNTNSGNPFHPAPMPVNRFLGGIDQIKLIPY